MHSDGGNFTGNRKKKEEEEEVISTLYILGCLWYLRWEMTCTELTLCVLTVRNCRLLNLIP